MEWPEILIWGGCAFFVWMTIGVLLMDKKATGTAKHDDTKSSIGGSILITAALFAILIGVRFMIWPS